MKNIKQSFFQGLSSFNTHTIEIDLEKVLKLDFLIENFRLYDSPFGENEDNFMKEKQNSLFFLDQQK